MRRRFIPYAEYDAADNMAIDEAILDAHLEGRVPPTLRVYGWKPPAVSIGYGQKLSAAIESRMQSKGYDVVRRPTGGRAVLHAFELTYSFVGGVGSADQLSESVIGAYKQICQGLICAFQELGVELSLGESHSSYKNAHDCFLATTSADLHYQGRKMIGSAQLRRRNAVLQHGSILLNQPQDLMRTLLREEELETAGQSNVDRHANLYEVLGNSVPISKLSQSLKNGFESAFQKEHRDDVLSRFERQLLEQYRPRYQRERAAI